MRIILPREVPPARETILGFTDRELQLIEQGLYLDESEGNNELWATFRAKCDELGLERLR